MFCSLCFSAKRPNYDRHSLRDFAGNTICPYLLSLKCSTCGQSGHTPKYCKNIYKTNINVENTFGINKKPETQYKMTRKVVKIAANSFMCLTVDNDDQEEEIDEYSYLIPSNVIWGKGFQDTLYLKWGDRD